MSEQKVNITDTSHLSSSIVKAQFITGERTNEMQVLSSAWNTGNCITGYDMVTALTQNTINLQFSLLWMKLPSKYRKLELKSTEKDPDLGEINFSFDGDMDAPMVILGTSSDPHFNVKLSINIPTGTLTYGVKNNSHKISNWKFVFDINVNFLEIEHERIQNHMAIPDAVKDMLHEFDSDDFTIRHLFMNFEDAEIADFDPTHSELPLPEGMSNLALNLFKLSLIDYFSKLANTDHPYILGYSIEQKAPTPDPSSTPTFIPTSGTYWIFKERDESQEYLSTLNLLLTADGRPLPYPTEPNFNNNWLISNDCNGRFVLAKNLFFENHLLPKLKKALNTYVTGVVSKSGFESEYNLAQGIEWSLFESPENSNSDWTYIYEKTFNWSIGFSLKVEHSLKNNFWFTVYPEKLENKAAIKVNGGFCIDYQMKGTNPNMFQRDDISWSISTVEWNATINVECGTHGVIKLEMSPEFNAQKFEGSIQYGVPLINALITQITDSVKNALESEIRCLNNSLEAVGSRFVLPAGYMYAFKNPQFDSFQNLLFDMTIKS
ncbi:hypothetical protein [Methanosarcina soligelidi]|uniref:hypothetical protein n=1 Tax=Methanosarcina soligelidi TaxID=1036677 RepID=UPI00064F2E6B|nr:hypothetical protein [Methanosarcina soligelidi]